MGTATLTWKRARTIIVVEVALVVMLSAVLRSYDLLHLPIYTDESIYLRRAGDMLEQRTRASLMIPILEDRKQPLFIWLLAAASYLSPDPLLGGRTVTVVAGVISSAGMYLAGYWLRGRKLGLVAGILYAVGPFNLFFDRLALMEGFVNMAGVWTFCLSVFMAKRVCGGRNSILWGVALGLVLATAIWTKTTALFLVPIPLLSWLLLSGRRTPMAGIKGCVTAYSVFGVFAALLAVVVGYSRLASKAQDFTMPLSQLVSLPWEAWKANSLAYLSWIQTYFPSPLWWLLPVAAARAISLRRRSALLLLLCWAAYTLPLTLTTLRNLFTTRYVLPGVFPLLLLEADLIVSAWDRSLFSYRQRLPARSTAAPQILAALLLLATTAPALALDHEMLTTPETARLTFTDRYHFVTSWASGYGFMDAVSLVKKRAAEITATGQPVIVLGDNTMGLPVDGLKLYMRGMPSVYIYVDGHLSGDYAPFLAAWRSHQVPLLVVGNREGRYLDGFEAAVPQAKRIGFFPKPAGQDSFRVYEVSVSDLGP